MPLPRRQVLAAAGASVVSLASQDRAMSAAAPASSTPPSAKPLSAKPLSERHHLIAGRIAALGVDLGSSRPGGAYAPAVEDRGLVEISGMTPSIDGKMVALGRVGAQLTLEQAQYAAKVSALRCLKALADQLGDLGRIRRVTKMTVYVQAAEGFHQLSEVSNGASELLNAVLAPDGAHARTTVGVFSIPRDAVLELDMTVSVDPA